MIVGSEHMHGKSNIYGVMLLVGYICSDSFTAQYQSRSVSCDGDCLHRAYVYVYRSLYKKYGKVDQYHMMFGINMW